MQDIAFFSTIAELRARLVRGESVPSDIIQEKLTWIDEANPAVNALIPFDVEGALRDAAAIAEYSCISGERQLSGIPVTIKEGIPCLGHRWTLGLTELASRKAHFESQIVTRLRQTGAIVVGRSNLAAGFADWQTDNPVYGRCNNPFDLARTAGGSGGGGAVAVAAGFSLCDLGTDLLGSLRLPAAFCGVHGLRPSSGRGSSGIWEADPTTRSALPPHAVCGLTARTADDLSLLWQSFRTRLEVPSTKEALRAAYLPPSVSLPINPEVSQTLAEGAAWLREVVPHAMILAEDYFGEITRIGRAAVTLAQARILQELRITAPDFTAFTTCGDDVLAAADVAEDLQQRLDAFFLQFDLLLLPMVLLEPFFHSPGRSLLQSSRELEQPVFDGTVNVPYWQLGAYAALSVLSGYPSLSCPCGSSRRGLPMAIQIMGRKDSEGLMIAVAQQLARADWVTAPALTTLGVAL